MKLTYRGVQYNETRDFSSSLASKSKDLIYRGNSASGRINPKFPWLRYIKQLFAKSESRPVFDPITFWYDHKREYIEDCWCLSNTEKLELAWDLTMKIEQAKAVDAKPKMKTKFKYRGVTYYR